MLPITIKIEYAVEFYHGGEWHRMPSRFTDVEAARHWVDLVHGEDHPPKMRVFRITTAELIVAEDQ